MDFIKARVDKMMGSTQKISRKLYLQVQTLLWRICWKQQSALVEASKEEDFKPSVESLSRAFNLAEKAEGVQYS